MIVHIVILQFASHIEKKHIKEVFENLGNLQHSVIPQIKEFTYGENCSNEGLSQGYNYGFTMKFSSSEDREIYLEHPEHKKIAEKIKSMLACDIDSVVVFDYEIK